MTSEAQHPLPDALPLAGVRVLDLCEDWAEATTRYLADLGATVVKVEPTGGAASRREAPLHDGASIPFALRNANKRSVQLDPATDTGRERLLALAAESDLLVESWAPGRLTALGLGPTALHAVNPALVVVSVTGFGQTGPYRDWQLTEPVLCALGGVLSRSGLPGGPPLLSPPGLLLGTVAVNAAWAGLLAYVHRLRTGQGQVVDVSALESVVHGFDPGFGTQGSAAAGRADTFPRGRPDARAFYPVFGCADGSVRICLLAKRQWRAMFAWLGEPAEFADPSFDTIPARFAAADRLHALIADLFAGSTRDELVAEGVRRGVPVAGVNTLGEVLQVEHLAVTGALGPVEVAPGVQAVGPQGFVCLDGDRVGYRTPAPALGAHDADPYAASPPLAPRDPEAEPPHRPLAGIRVLDLGVIVFGAELGRHLADQGADVVKVENEAFADGLRQSRRGSGMSPSFAWGQRNKRGLGLDLRHPEGAALFRRLVAEADVVLANFKPGTLEGLGLSWEQLREVNPRLVLSDSSAFGATGPWSSRMGYGPLVRSSCGVSDLWRQPGEESSDGSTVYPDHVAGQVTAIAVLAALVRRERTGSGGCVQVAQADTAVVQLGALLVAESLAPGTVGPRGNDVGGRPGTGVHPCAGDDEWCVVSVRDAQDEARLRDLVGAQALPAWLSERSPAEAMAALQSAGVPAGAMLRLPDELQDPQLLSRGSFTALDHPGVGSTLPASARSAVFGLLPDPELRPAPEAGEHTLEVLHEWLGLDDAALEPLVSSGVLQRHQPLAAAPSG